METDAAGALRLLTPGGELHMKKPLVYQEIDGRRREVAGRYAIQEGEGKTMVAFKLEDYARHAALVIDPVVEYSTYLGGEGREYGRGIAVDGAGNAYDTGRTTSTDFYTLNGQFKNLYAPSNAFVTQLCPQVHLVDLFCVFDKRRKCRTMNEPH